MWQCWICPQRALLSSFQGHLEEAAPRGHVWDMGKHVVGNLCVLCQLPTRNCCSRALASGWAKHYLSFPAKLLSLFWEKGKALAVMPRVSVLTGCLNVLHSSNGELLLLASQKEEGKLSSGPGRCGACVVVLPKDALSLLRDISAAGGVILWPARWVSCGGCTDVSWKLSQS